MRNLQNSKELAQKEKKTFSYLSYINLEKNIRIYWKIGSFCNGHSRKQYNIKKVVSCSIGSLFISMRIIDPLNSLHKSFLPF